LGVHEGGAQPRLVGELARGIEVALQLLGASVAALDALRQAGDDLIVRAPHPFEGLCVFLAQRGDSVVDDLRDCSGEAFEFRRHGRPLARWIAAKLSARATAASCAASTGGGVAASTRARSTAWLKRSTMPPRSAMRRSFASFSCVSCVTMPAKLPTMLRCISST